MLYNDPGRMSATMDDACLDLLGGSANFLAIRESSGEPERLHMLACADPHIALSCGMDDQALEFFARGARSWVCAGAKFAPEAHVALYRAWTTGSSPPAAGTGRALPGALWRGGNGPGSSRRCIRRRGGCVRPP